MDISDQKLWIFFTAFMMSCSVELLLKVSLCGLNSSMFNFLTPIPKF